MTTADAAVRRDDDDRVLPFGDWTELAGISKATGRRITKPDGGGPPLVRLSARRVGIVSATIAHG